MCQSVLSSSIWYVENHSASQWRELGFLVMFSIVSMIQTFRSLGNSPGTAPSLSWGELEEALAAAQEAENWVHTNKVVPWMLENCWKMIWDIYIWYEFPWKIPGVFVLLSGIIQHLKKWRCAMSCHMLLYDPDDLVKKLQIFLGDIGCDTHSWVAPK